MTTSHGPSRDRDTSSLEARFASNEAVNPGEVAWLVGAYGQRLHETGHDTSVGEYVDPFELRHQRHARRVSRQPLSRGHDRYLRAARWRGHFEDCAGRSACAASGATRTTGMRASGRTRTASPTSVRTTAWWAGSSRGTYAISSALTTYASISRGYKAGGFNLGAVPEDRLRFRPEYLWNYEYGFKYAAPDRRFYADISAFYSRRRDVQVRTGDQLDPSDPNSYVFFTDNASRGYNYGVESSLRVAADGAVAGGRFARPPAHALSGLRPGRLRCCRIASRRTRRNIRRRSTLNWRHPTGWTGRVGLTALDKFYFDVPPNDTQSGAYVLTNVQFGYETARWSAMLWGRNVFDREYAIRGFYFGNEPPNFENKLYIQRGDPRQVGVSFHYSFR